MENEMGEKKEIFQKFKHFLYGKDFTQSFRQGREE